VHLTDWPDPADLPADDELVAAMDRARDVCSAALGLRKAEGLRVRLPLESVTVVSSDAGALAPFADLISDEVHVHDVRLLGLDDDSEAARFGVEQRLTVNARAAGPRLGKDVQAAIRASKSGDWTVADDGTVVSGGIALVDGEYVLETVVSGAQDEGKQAVGVLPREGFVVLDTDVTPELQAVGIVRDVIRVVQQARREAGLHVSDRIRLTVVGDEPVWRALAAHEAMLTTETLAVQAGLSGDLAHLPAGDGVTEATVGDGQTVRVKVERTSAS
jgi:isoleucyl-tRNA synthetase